MSEKEIKNEGAEKTEEKSAKPAIPELKSGMVVRVYQKIKELSIKGEEKERVQYFEGRIIAMKHGKEKGATITVRKVSDGVGVEKIFPINLPTIEKIIIKKEAKTRRAKLTFLKKGYRKKLKETIIKE
jgi:large subunit ribosomal protein L19